MDGILRQLGFLQVIPTFREPVADRNAGTVCCEHGYRFGAFVVGVKGEPKACTQGAVLVLLEHLQPAHADIHHRLTTVDIDRFVGNHRNAIDIVIHDMSVRCFHLTDIVGSDIYLLGTDTLCVGTDGNGSRGGAF